MDQLTKSEAARLSALEMDDYIENHRELYLEIARKLKAAFPEVTHVDDRINGAAAWIEILDTELQFKDLHGMEMREVCRLLAKTVVGHEDDK